MPDWTVLGASAITGAVAYSAARIQGRVAERSANLTAQAQLRQAEVELERLDREYGRASREARTAAYQRVLDLWEEYELLMVSHDPPTATRYDEWNRLERSAANEVRLIATGSVRDAVEEVEQVLWRAATRAAKTAVAEGDYEAALHANYAGHRKSFNDAVTDAVDAMRDDVGVLEQDTVTDTDTGSETAAAHHPSFVVAQIRRLGGYLSRFGA